MHHGDALSLLLTEHGSYNSYIFLHKNGKKQNLGNTSRSSLSLQLRFLPTR